MLSGHETLRRPSELRYAALPASMPQIGTLTGAFPHNQRLRYGFAQELIGTKHPAACAAAGALLCALIDEGCAFEEDARLLTATLALALGEASLGRAMIDGWVPSSAEHRTMFSAIEKRLEGAPTNKFAVFGEAAVIVARALDAAPLGGGRLAALGPNASLAILSHPELPVLYALNLVYAATLDDAPIDTFICAEPDWPASLMQRVLELIARLRPASVRLILGERCQLPSGFEWVVDEMSVESDRQLSIDASFPATGSDARRTILFAYGKRKNSNE